MEQCTEEYNNVNTYETAATAPTANLNYIARICIGIKHFNLLLTV